ncbi:COX15/CtaA family protein [Marinobacterium jannaschii]|uniref:COX15/CtaA family protein n=1 Tax=Marinobacterium jannaschii TaxID=64970 RepID=UPI00068644D3|nr:COX15/CtaA family protein [Marinobacterium jannaschii]
MKRIRLLAGCAIALALVVVLLGGWTRLNDAGLGCPDWPGCYGTMILPSDPQQLQLAQQAYPEVPLVPEKGWLEMIHRYAAASLGLVILVLALVALKRRGEQGYPLKLSLGLLLLVIVQGMFGMWTVTMKLLPQVVTLHLLGGLTTLALLIRLRQRLATGSDQGGRSGLRQAVQVGFLLLFIQFALGGWTSSNYAGWACSHWLQCEAEEVVRPDFAAGFSLPELGEHSFEGGLLPREARAAIQIVHRLAAVVVVIYLLGIALTALYKGLARGPALVLIALVLLQSLLGIANVIYALPLHLAVAHHGGAVLLLISLLWLYQRISRHQGGEIHA